MSVNNLSTFLNIKDSHLRVVSGNVYAQGLNIGGITVDAAHGLQSITNQGNATTNTLEFTNATTAFVTTANVTVGRDLTVTGNALVSSNLTVTGNVTVSDDLTVTENLFVSNNLTVTGNTFYTNPMSISVDSNVVAEYTGPHDRPLRKYPEIILPRAAVGADYNGYRIERSSEHVTGTYLGVQVLFNNTAVDYTDTWGGGWQGSTGAYSTSTGVHTTFVTGGTTQGTGANLSSSSGVPNGEWVSLQVSTPIKLDNVEIRSRNISSGGETQFPKDFQFWGSNDGTTWYLIKSFTGVTSSGISVIHKYNVNSTTLYNRFALVVTKIPGETSSGANDGAAHFSISELRFNAHEEGDSSLDTTLKSVYNVPGTQQLEVYYDAKNYTSGVVQDLSTNSFNGTLTNGASYNNSDGISKFAFDAGTNQYMTTTTDISGEFIHTTSMWVKFVEVSTVSSEQYYLFILGTFGTNSIGMYYSANHGIRVATPGFDYRSQYHPVAGKWFHVSYTYAGGAHGTAAMNTTVKFYINGKQWIIPAYYGSTSTVTLPSSSVLQIYSSVGNTLMDMEVANFRLFSKALNAGQVQELYDYQKDYFLGTRSSVTLYKGHLGIGVAEPSGQLELAGDERIQEYPPRRMTHSDGTATGSQTAGKSKNITYIEGHGEFKASASAQSTGSLNYDGQQPYNAFDRTTSYWLMYENVGYNNTTGAYEDNVFKLSASSGTPYGHWLKLEMPYTVNIKNYFLDGSGQNYTPHDWQIWASNDDTNWTHIHSYSGETYDSSNGRYYTVSHTGHYKMFAIIVTSIHAGATHNGSATDRLAIREMKYFGTPGPTTLDKGSLSLTRSLDVPRISRYDVDTETPRPEKLVVDFDTTVNSSPTDISGQGNHGILKSNCTYSAADKAFDFPGDGDRIDGCTFNGYSGAVIQSHSYWVKGATANVKSPVTVGRQTFASDGEYLSLLVDTGGWQINADGWSHDYDETIDTTRWYHVVVTYDGGSSTSSYKLYIDGKYKTPTGSNGPFGSLSLEANTNIRIGRDSGVGWFTGMISNIKIYNVALEPSEVKKLYNLGRTGRSMVISDTAVGIGKVPEAQLDVRGNLNVSSFIKYDSAWFYANDGDTSGTGDDFNDYTGFVPWNSLQTGSKHFSTASASTSGGYYTAPVDGIYHFDTSILNYPDARSGISGIFFSVNDSTGGETGNNSYGYNRKTNMPEQENMIASATFRLDEGDTVKVYVTNMDCYTQTGHAFFSGYLVTRI